MLFRSPQAGGKSLPQVGDLGGSARDPEDGALCQSGHGVERRQRALPAPDGAGVPGIQVHGHNQRAQQPASLFVLRLKAGRDGEQPTVSLTEADGGAWKNQAIASIKEFFAGSGMYVIG